MDYRLIIYFSIIQIHQATGCIFGNSPECTFPCRCQNNAEQCDAITGTCVSGCKQWEPFPPSGARQFGWSGHGCTIGNIALGKSAEQNGDYRNTTKAEKAVDGILQQQEYTGDPSSLENCVHTNVEYRSDAWWRIDLGELHAVLNVTIFNRFELGDRTGYFTIGVGNTSHNSQHSECVRYGGEIPDRGSKSFSCPQPLLGLYVSLVRYGGTDPNILNFCEIVIVGYKVVLADCSKCRTSCDSIVGCQDCEFRKPPYCNAACEPGTYGISCRSSCESHHCMGGYTTCHPVNGSCLKGCDNWYKDSECDTYINEANLNHRSGVQVTVMNDHSVKLVWQAATGIKPELAHHYGYIVQRKSDTGFQEVVRVPHQAGPSNYSAVVDQLQENTVYTFRLSVFRQHGSLTEVLPHHIDGINVTTACIGAVRDINLQIGCNGPPYYIFADWQRRCESIAAIALYYRQVGTSEWSTQGVAHPLIITLVQLPIKHLGIYEVKVRSINNVGQVNETWPAVVEPENLGVTDDPFLELTIALSVLCAAFLFATATLVVKCLRQSKESKIHKKQDSLDMTPVVASGATGEYCIPSEVTCASNAGEIYDVIQLDKKSTAEPYYEAK